MKLGSKILNDYDKHVKEPEQNEYTKQAQEFLDNTDTTVSAVFDSYGPHFEDDKDCRDIYNVTITRGSRSFSFKFGQSINESRYHAPSNYNSFREGYKRLKAGTRPSAYDILACLTKYDPEDFEFFCDNYGYDNDSRKAERIYNAVCKEYRNVCSLWNDSELEQLQEIN